MDAESIQITRGRPGGYLPPFLSIRAWLTVPRGRALQLLERLANGRAGVDSEILGDGTGVADQAAPHIDGASVRVDRARGRVAMKVAILVVGQGTRLAEETRVKSKRWCRIGEQPILLAWGATTGRVYPKSPGTSWWRPLEDIALAFIALRSQL